MSSKYGGRGGSDWRPSGPVSGTDYFTLDGGKQTRQPRKRKSNTPNKQRKPPKLTATRADRIVQPVTRNPGSGWSRLGAGAGSAAVVSGIGFIGSKLDKADMYALRKSQRYLKANPMGSPELGGDNPKKGYMGRATWKANTRRAIEDMNKFDNRPSVPLSNAGSNAPVSTRPPRPASSPVAKSRFDQNVKAAIAKFPPRKTAAPNPAPKLPALKTQTVTTHSVDKVRSGAAGSGGPQTGKSKTRIAFEKKFAAERRKQGAGGTFKFKNPNTGKTTTHTTNYKKAKKKK